MFDIMIDRRPGTKCVPTSSDTRLGDPFTKIVPYYKVLSDDDNDCLPSPQSSDSLGPSFTKDESMMI